MERRKFVIGMGALASGAAASVGTGAFTAMQADGREATIDVVNDESALIGLKAGDTDLVTGTSDGQLAISFDLDDHGDGVNPNSTYQVGGLGEDLDLGAAPGTDSVPDFAIDTETDIESEYAFKVSNQTADDQQIDLIYEANEEFPEDATLIMFAYYAASPRGQPFVKEALLEPSDGDRSASIVWAEEQSGGDFTTPISPGDEFYVTVIVDVGDVEPEVDLGGEIVVRAGSHDEFTELGD